MRKVVAEYKSNEVFGLSNRWEVQVVFSSERRINHSATMRTRALAEAYAQYVIFEHSDKVESVIVVDKEAKE